MSRKNVSSADNQQERLRIESWIVGFTDGEGCFSVSLLKNQTMRCLWQVFPEFVITQGKKSLPALQLIHSYFGCGKVFENKRYDNHKEHLYRYCVRSFKDLQETIIPFFKKNPLITAKQHDFEIFCQIVDLMSQKVHVTQDGLHSIAVLIEQMNRKKASRFLESSETTR